MVQKVKKSKKKETLVAVSGGFDPLHVGHVRLFEGAKRLAGLDGKLVVILNGDAWLKRKKGYVFMPAKERAEVIKALTVVDDVFVYNSAKRDDVSEALVKIKPDIFVNGGDRDEKNAADPHSSLYKDEATCKKHGIKMVFGVGKGGKVQSSSWLVRDALDAIARMHGDSVTHLYHSDHRPWGHFTDLVEGKTWHLKTIHITPKKRLSLQYHHKRTEHWFLLEGDAYAHYEKNKKMVREKMKKHIPVVISPKQKHRLEGGAKEATILELSVGSFDEKDIVRVEDDHGRCE